jgi:hypothetical protein
MSAVICNDLPQNLTRFAEILAHGPRLRDEAARGCDCLNASYFLVHEVMTATFGDDPHLTASAALGGQLSGRLNAKLTPAGAT